MTSRLKPTSLRAQAERYLRAMDDWIPSAELAQHLGINRKDVAATLRVALRCGTIIRRTGKGGVVSWSMANPKPDVPFALDWPPGFKSRFFEVRA